MRTCGWRYASITITVDRYGHLLPGAEDEAVVLVDAYIARATEAAAAGGPAGQSTAPRSGFRRP